MLTKIDELNRPEYEAISYEDYFAPMDIPEEDKEKRVDLAEEIDDIYFDLFALILALSAMGEYQDKFYYEDYIRTRLDDVVERYDYQYLYDYSSISAENTARTTFEHQGEEYYLSDERASLLAAENAQSIANYTELQEAIEKGFTHKTWKAEKDKRTRRDHREMDGKTIRIEEYFIFPDCQGLCPHDEVNLTPRQTANCRCSLGYSVRDSQNDNQENEQTGFGDPAVDWEKYSDDVLNEKLANLNETEETTLGTKENINEILKHRDGTHFEDLAYINSVDGTSKINKDFDYYVDGISKCKPSVEMDSMLESVGNGKIIGIHNHPGSSIVTAEDIVIAQERGYKYGLVAAHNGTIYQYKINRKEKYTQADYSAIQHRLSQYFTSMFNPDIISVEEAVKDLLDIGIDLKVL